MAMDTLGGRGTCKYACTHGAQDICLDALSGAVSGERASICAIMAHMVVFSTLQYPIPPRSALLEPRKHTKAMSGERVQDFVVLE